MPVWDACLTVGFQMGSAGLMNCSTPSKKQNLSGLMVQKDYLWVAAKQRWEQGRREGGKGTYKEDLGIGTRSCVSPPSSSGAAICRSGTVMSPDGFSKRWRLAACMASDSSSAPRCMAMLSSYRGIPAKVLPSLDRHSAACPLICEVEAI